MSGTGSGQWQYEAYEVANYTRDKCEMRKECNVIVRGCVLTNVTSSTESNGTQAAAYYANGTMLQLLGISSNIPQLMSDIVSVSFHWPLGVQSVVLLYIRRSTCNRNVTLMHLNGTQTNRFQLEALSDMCHICRSSASVIRNMKVSTHAFGLDIDSAKSEWKRLHLGI